MDALKLPVLKTPRLTLRLATVEDAAQIVRYQIENRERFAPTSPKMSQAIYTEAHWVESAENAKKEFLADQALRLFLFDDKSGDVVGTVSFTQLCRGPFQACYLGYAIGGRFEGQGLMAEALRTAIDYVFKVLNLHRIMANYLPDNERSARVLQRLGFAIEGRAPEYLRINGAWREHVLTALTNREWKEA